MQDDEIFARAVRDGDTVTVARMLRAVPGLAGPRGADGGDPVALAARHRRLEVLRLLVEAPGPGAAPLTPPADSR